jgi:hypothetical protein
LQWVNILSGIKPLDLANLRFKKNISQHSDNSQCHTQAQCAAEKDKTLYEAKTTYEKAKNSTEEFAKNKFMQLLGPM